MDRWAGKVAVVTGASAGIGAAIVVDLVKAGMIVVGLARRKDRVEQLQSQIPTDVAGKLYAVQCDVSDDSSVVETFKWISIEFGAIHVLINNAGIGGGGGAITDEGNEEYLKSIIQTNLWGLVLCTKKAIEIMKREKVTGAHIININSKLGYKVSYVNTTSRPFWSVYPASKFAVTALTEVLRQEFNNDNFQFRVTVSNQIYIKLLLYF